MRNVVWLWVFLFSVRSFAQTERIITYENGNPEYIVYYEGNAIQRNICLSPTGDTIYSWDINKKMFIDYPLTGEYLSRAEYSDFKKQILTRHNTATGDSTNNLGDIIPVSPLATEWKMMHDYFFKKCPIYTKVINEGPFSIHIAYQGSERSGPFKKYYNGFLVESGQYVNDERKGIWTYHPYQYYPYSDLVIVNIWGKDFSILYALMPGAIIIILSFIIGRSAVKNDTYSFYFYGVLLLAIVSLLLRLYLPYDRERIIVKEIVPATWFTLWHLMILLSVINLFFSRRTKPPVIVNMACLLIGLSFSIFVIFFKHLNF
jgi:antitoxin component YwqK of YwqJK toxin-antitoxin module